jgi:acylphosphatase
MVVGMSQAATRKVEVRNGYEIVVDGTVVGRLDGRPEVYVVLNGQPRAVARFKRYLNKASARQLATRWVKFVLARLTVAEVLEKIGDDVPFEKRVSPMQLAWDLGMPKPSPVGATLPASPFAAKLIFG